MRKNFLSDFSLNLLDNKTLPNDYEAEKALLSSILLNPNIVSNVIDKLEVDDFYWPAHRAIFKAILNLYEQNLSIDIVTVANEIKKLNLEGELEYEGGISYLATLLEPMALLDSYYHYIEIIKSKSVRSKIIRISLETIQDSLNEQEDINYVLDRAQRKIIDLSTKKNTKDYESISDVLATVLEQLEVLTSENRGYIGIPTGFEAIDKMTSGLQPGDLIIIAARPSMGKTAFALNIAHNISTKYKLPVLIFSIEMSKEQIAQRILSLESNIPLAKIRSGALSVNDMDKLAETISFLSEQPLFIDDTPNITTIDIRSKARKLKIEKKVLGAIIIDYLQLIKGDSEYDSRVQELSQISRSLKALAKELNVPVIALSQLSREVEKRNDKRPMLSDLRESGAIEQEADLVMFLYREDYYNKDTKKTNLTEVIIAKQRNGPTGSILLYFGKDILKFFPTTGTL
ncbi:MAG: replicative DNA helicase [bacterium]|jgi:replicative DNA helicase